MTDAACGSSLAHPVACSPDTLHEKIKAGIQAPAAYTVRQCVTDWLDSLELDPHTVATYRGAADKWIYPAIGATKLKDFKATDADRFFRNTAQALAGTSPNWLTCRRASRAIPRGP
jgi:hypothetical protein